MTLCNIPLSEPGSKRCPDRTLQPACQPRTAFVLFIVVAEYKSYESSDSEPTLSDNTSFNINHIFMFYFINTPVHIKITASDEWTTSFIYSTQISFASTCVSRNSNVPILLHCSVTEIHRTPLDTISCYSGNSFDIIAFMTTRVATDGIIHYSLEHSLVLILLCFVDMLWHDL